MEHVAPIVATREPERSTRTSNFAVNRPLLESHNRLSDAGSEYASACEFHEPVPPTSWTSIICSSCCAPRLTPELAPEGPVPASAMDARQPAGLHIPDQLSAYEVAKLAQVVGHASNLASSAGLLVFSLIAQHAWQSTTCMATEYANFCLWVVHDEIHYLNLSGIPHFRASVQNSSQSDIWVIVVTPMVCTFCIMHIPACHPYMLYETGPCTHSHYDNHVEIAPLPSVMVVNECAGRWRGGDILAAAPVAICPPGCGADGVGQRARSAGGKHAWLDGRRSGESHIHYSCSHA